MQKIKKVSTSLGHTMYVDEHDHIGIAIINNGIFEKNNIELIKSISKKIDAENILDIGGNIGNHALAFSLFSKHVWSFEPNPSPYDLLVKNISENKIKNISALNFGLSETDESSILYSNESGNSGASTLCKNCCSPDQQYQEKKVILRNGDNWIEQNISSRIDILKIDTEGYEPSVIRGLSRTISKHRPIILMEWLDGSNTQNEFINGNIFDSIFMDYSVFSIRMNTDGGYWRNKKLKNIRRSFTKIWHGGKKPITEPFFFSTNFQPSHSVKDILLVPNEKTKILP